MLNNGGEQSPPDSELKIAANLILKDSAKGATKIKAYTIYTSKKLQQMHTDKKLQQINRSSIADGRNVFYEIHKSKYDHLAYTYPYNSKTDGV